MVLTLGKTNKLDIYIDLVEEPKIQENTLILVQQTCLKMTEQTSMFQIENFSITFQQLWQRKRCCSLLQRSISIIRINQPSELSNNKVQFKNWRCNLYIKINNIQFGPPAGVHSRDKFPDQHWQIFIGDVNIEASENLIVQEFKKKNFRQLVTFPTHEDGRIIDHCYISNLIQPETIKLKQKAVH